MLQVFECVMSWVNGDLAIREAYLAELMEYVRLPLLSQDYLIQRVEEEPLLKQDAQCKYASPLFLLYWSLLFTLILHIEYQEKASSLIYKKVIYIWFIFT